METLQPLLGLALLLATLFVVEFFTRPKDTAWYMRRFTKNLKRQQRVIGKKLVPAFEEATIAFAGLAAVLATFDFSELEDPDA